MGRPKLTRAEQSDRKKVGKILVELRAESGLSLREAAYFADIKWARLWQLEKGKAPYDKVFGRVVRPYGITPEELIKRAKGQLAFELISAVVGERQEPTTNTMRYTAMVTPEQKELLDSFLGWLRIRPAPVEGLGRVTTKQ